MADLLFQTMPSITPTIYAYSDPNYPGMLKVGYTQRTMEERMREHYPTLLPTDKKPYRIEFTASAMRPDGSIFIDKDVHRYLERDLHCIPQYYMDEGTKKKTEWYQCSIEDVKKAHYAAYNRLNTVIDRIYDFKMRPEQEAAVKKTMEYYRSASNDPTGRIPKFLWNAKMRFGKTFASYELAKAMGFKKVLVLTFKPAVKTAWREDLLSHKDFEGWQFLSQPHDPALPSIDEQYEDADKSRPIVCFGSFQDLLGYDKSSGSIKAHNEWIHLTNWDLVIFDEYHYGAWRKRAKDLFEMEDEETFSSKEEDDEKKDTADDSAIAIDETFLPITTNHYLFLSGTPFRALNSGEFIEEQIYSWTYSDEQRAKENWKGSDPNPYRTLPHMVMMTYQMPDSITKIAMEGEFNEFDLNVFFSAKSETGNKSDSQFVYKDYVQKWLYLIRGSYLETSVDNLKLGKKPPFPFSDTRLLSMLRHTLWFLPNIASCYAMKNLLSEPQNTFYDDFKIIVCAGSEAGQGADALDPVYQAMGDPLKSRTITLSCGKLTTGVTVRPWTGVFMLRNLSQPETYFQTAFRVQSPWTYKDESGELKIIKEVCYVFDFALNRTLRQLSEYSCKLNPTEANPETKVGEFIKFLPVLAYDEGRMRQISASDILDIAISGTSATLLARRWESALLVNVDNLTLERLLSNEDAMSALMSIEGFRNLNKDIETIINNSKAIKNAKRTGEKNKGQKEKKELSEKEKEMKSKRKLIQEKLIKFATRIPVFMYLTDFREICLKDVINQLEPELFKKVTGLEVKDFNLLVSLGVFNDSLMNDAIYKFRRYEERSLDYTGINKHAGKDIGGWNTAMTKKDVETIYGVSDPYSLEVGEEVEVNGYGRCVVDKFYKGKVYLKRKDTEKSLPDAYIYPNVLKIGTIKKL